MLLGVLGVLSATDSLRDTVWSAGSVAWILPPLLLATAALLGVAFRQLRIALMALIVGTVFWGLDAFPGDMPQGALHAALACLAVSSAAIVFLLAPEQRAFSQWGIARVSVALLVAGLLVMLPELERAQAWTDPPLRSVLSGLVFPPLAAVALAVLLAVAILWSRPESPHVGRFFFALALCTVILVNAHAIAVRAGLPVREFDHAFRLVNAALLFWLSIDCGWHNAFIDELTQLPGRRPMRHHFASLGRDYALATVDIDHFKKINDTYGHDVGDQALRRVAGQLRAFRHGTAYRFGGEEFVIVMPRADAEVQVRRLNELRERIAATPFIVRGADRPKKKPAKGRTARKPASNQFHITVSIGVAHPREGAVPDDVLKAADRALYTAKRTGRNRVCTG